MAQQITDKQALQEWKEYLENIRKSTALENGETEVQKRRRIARLEANPEEWFKYYFPRYVSTPDGKPIEPAEFHTESTKRVLANMEWYEVRAWSRELSKSTRTMFEVLYMILTGKKRYVLLISNSYDNAERLLSPYKANLEVNQRIINDYGQQMMPGKWEAGEFTTCHGAAFRALGAGQSPRGTRNEEVRPDVILIDDIDTDEECRNPDLIEKKWAWVEDAAMATRSISVPLLVIFCGNIIGEVCCIVKARQYADHFSIVNIRDEHGVSSWPSKNSEEQIERVLAKKSYNSQQKEYYNNPIADGNVFKEIRWEQAPPLSSFPFLLMYGDPSPSNKDQLKAKNQTSYKCVALLGFLNGRYWVLNCFLDQVINSEFVEWYYAMERYIGAGVFTYAYIENNTLQDPFYEQVFRPLFFSVGRRYGHSIGIMPDERKKPDKYIRIEGTLQPKHRDGNLVFNAAEKNNPHMRRLEAQFKSVSPQCKIMDGPDAVEGGIHLLENKMAAIATDDVRSSSRERNKSKYY